MKRKLTLILIVLLLFSMFASLVSAQVNTASVVSSFSKPIDPDLYLIRPGDKFEITFVGKSIPNKKWTVDSEGRVVDESSGLIDLSDKTLTEAKEVIKNVLARYYQFDEIVVSIQARQVLSLPVTGEVASPGRYNILPGQPVTDIIDSAGGLSEAASNRSLHLVRYKDTLKFDFINNIDVPLAYAGLELIIPEKSEKIITIIGAVRNPGTVEFISEINLSDLLPFVGGLTKSADSSKAYAVNDRSKKVWQGNELTAGDIINIPILNNAQSNNLKLFGAVVRPGHYDLDDNNSIQTLFRNAGGLTGQANKDRITVFRKTEADAWGIHINKRYPLLASFLNETDFKLVADDSVFVPVKVGYVTVEGLVSNPGTFAFDTEKNIASYISLAGGIVGKSSEVDIFWYDRITKINSLANESGFVKDGDIIKVLPKEQTE